MGSDRMTVGDFMDMLCTHVDEDDPDLMQAEEELTTYDANKEDREREFMFVERYMGTTNALDCIQAHYSDGWFGVLAAPVRLPGLGLLSVWRALLQRTSAVFPIYAVIRAPDPTFALIKHMRYANEEKLSRLSYFIDALESMGYVSDLVPVIAAAKQSLVFQTHAIATPPPPPAQPRGDEHRFFYFLDKYVHWVHVLGGRTTQGAPYKHILQRMSERMRSKIYVRGDEVVWHMLSVLDEEDKNDNTIDRMTPLDVLNIIKPLVGTSDLFKDAVTAFTSFDRAAHWAVHESDVLGNTYTRESNDVKALLAHADSLSGYLNNTYAGYWASASAPPPALWKVLAERTSPSFPVSMVASSSYLISELARHPDEEMSRLTVFAAACRALTSGRLPKPIEIALLNLVKKQTTTTTTTIPQPLKPPPALEPLQCTACSDLFNGPDDVQVCNTCWSAFCLDCCCEAKKPGGTGRCPGATGGSPLKCVAPSTCLQRIGFGRRKKAE